MDRDTLSAHDHAPEPDELKRRAQSAAGNATQITVLEIFGGIGKYHDNQVLVGSNTVVLSEILAAAAHKDNWRDEVQLAFDGTPEQVAQLIVAADLYGQAVHDGMDPATAETFAMERGYINGDDSPASQAVGLSLGQYRRFWDAETIITEAGGPGFDPPTTS